MTDPQISWSSPIFPLKLERGEVHIWRVKLKQPYLRVRRLSPLLSENERIRAENYRFEKDRERFIIGRGVLRTILGYYLGTDPTQMEFRYGIYGKPRLAEKFCKDGIQFNLAHSHNLALYALTKERKVGVDLEYVRDIPNPEDVAARFFSKRENKILRRLPENQQQEAFYNFWTRKEAYLKAIDYGLAQPFDQFEVSLIPGDPANLLKVEGVHKKDVYWSMRTITPAHGYRAALVVEGHNWNPLFFQFMWTWKQPKYFVKNPVQSLFIESR